MTKAVVTLIANPYKEKLTMEHVALATDALTKAGAYIITNEWLSFGEACDVMFSQIPLDMADKAVSEAFAVMPIDAIVQETAHRQKRLFISDMDSTIITIECIDEIADFAGVKSHVSAITERAMRGELDFAAALTERVALLKGLQEATLQTVYDERVKFMPGARELVATMRSHGAYTVLVSGGFDFFTSRVRHELGFHEDHSNRLEVADGVLTGNVLLPILDRNSKLESLLHVTAEKGLSLSETLAAGDGANDLPMLMAAGLGAAYHAKPVVQQSARARINHCDLSALLFAQGYKREEFVTAT